MEYRICKPLGFAGLFKKEEIPQIKTNYFVLAPILAGEIDLDLLNYLHDLYPDKLCMDIQGFVRMIDKEKDEIYFCNLEPAEKKKILSKIKILKLDRAEAKALTGKDDIIEACKALSEYGPDEILLSHDKGISLYAYNEYFFFPWKNRVLKGRTGRGDTAFIGYVGSRISKTPRGSLRFSVALTSLKLESPGPFNEPISKVNELIEQELS
jgi:sugar/nucleoside kinase (ribokinase family)